MRKNLLIATLVSLCVIGVTACSKGEENKPADESATAPSPMPSSRWRKGQNPYGSSSFRALHRDGLLIFQGWHRDQMT